jgi:ABC-type sugar transport system permease subunit
VGSGGLGRRLRARRRLAFLIPAAVASLFLTGYPVVYSLWISLHAYNLQVPGIPFIGLRNFAAVLNDPAFWQSAATTLRIAIPSLTLELVLGMAMALAFDRVHIPGRGLMISLLLTPMLLPGAAAALAFGLIFVPQYGPLNALLGWIAHRAVQVGWLTSGTIAPWSIVIVEVWQKTSFVMLFLLAGLATIPEELYEAATIDRVSPLQTFRFIIIPLLRPTLVAVVVMRLIDLAKMFDIPFLLTAGGPGDATRPVSMYIFQSGFQFLRIGYAAAQSIVLALGIGLVLGILLAATQFWDETPA